MTLEGQETLPATLILTPPPPRPGPFPSLVHHHLPHFLRPFITWVFISDPTVRCGFFWFASWGQGAPQTARSHIAQAQPHCPGPRRIPSNESTQVPGFRFCFSWFQDLWSRTCKIADGINQKIRGRSLRDSATVASECFGRVVGRARSWVSDRAPSAWTWRLQDVTYPRNTVRQSDDRKFVSPWGTWREWSESAQAQCWGSGTTAMLRRPTV